MKRKIYLFAAALSLLCTTACDSLLDIDAPTDSMTDTQVYSTEESIEALAEGLYSDNFSNMFYLLHLELFGGFSADELRYRSTSYDAFCENTYIATTSNISNFWSFPYSTIYHCNDFILNVEPSTVISEAKKNVCLGEARYFRAYSYFLLVNFFGDVPLVLTNNYDEARLYPRTPKAQVYEQIISDLQKAEVELAESGNPNTKITAEAAKALLARVYLYTQQWQLAANKASELIPTADGGTGTKFALEEVDDVFKSTSTESILSLNALGRNGTGSFQGYTMIGQFLIASSNNPSYYLCDELVNDIQEEAADLRQHWIAYKTMADGTQRYYLYKYKYNQAPVPAADYEYQAMLRLAEQYLIRAEARAHLNDYTGAVKDINTIRHRAGVADMPATTDADAILLAVEKERRKELFVENGHRWFDLNRTGRADAVYSQVSYKKWTSEKSLWPVPDTERGRNPNLSQNPGY